MAISVSEQHEALAPLPRRASALGRRTKRSIFCGRRTSACSVLRSLGPHQLERESEAEIGNERERMRRIDGERRQHREDARHEMIVEPVAIGLRQIAGLDDDDADILDLARAIRASAASARR